MNFKHTAEVSETVNVSLLDMFEKCGVIQACLNDTMGGDYYHDTTSNNFTRYAYNTSTPFEAQEMESGTLKMVREYKEMPLKFNTNGDRISYWFCACCYSWIKPQLSRLKVHIILHLRQNLKCTTCNGLFVSKKVLDYQQKISHELVKCREDHSAEDLDGNEPQNVKNFRRYHFQDYYQNELGNVSNPTEKAKHIQGLIEKYCISVSNKLSNDFSWIEVCNYNINILTMIE